MLGYFNYFRAAFHYSKLFHLILFTNIYGYFQKKLLLLLFHLRLLSVILWLFYVTFIILGYFTLGYFLLL
jgi:hypothetical protein